MVCFSLNGGNAGRGKCLKCGQFCSYFSSKLESSGGACRKEPRHLIGLVGVPSSTLLHAQHNFVQREAYGFSMINMCLPIVIFFIL